MIPIVRFPETSATEAMDVCKTAESQIAESDNDIISAVNSLSELIGTNISPDAEFILPEDKLIMTDYIDNSKRPENHLYDLQKNYFNTLKDNIIFKDIADLCHYKS